MRYKQLKQHPHSTHRAQSISPVHQSIARFFALFVFHRKIKKSWVCVRVRGFDYIAVIKIVTQDSFFLLQNEMGHFKL